METYQLLKIHLLNKEAAEIAIGRQVKMSTVVEMLNVTKTFGEGSSIVKALDGVDIRIEKGEFVAIVGASGSGKSTMMNLIGCLDRPTSGLVWPLHLR